MADPNSFTWWCEGMVETSPEVLDTIRRWRWYLKNTALRSFGRPAYGSDSNHSSNECRVYEGYKRCRHYLSVATTGNPLCDRIDNAFSFQARNSCSLFSLGQTCPKVSPGLSQFNPAKYCPKLTSPTIFPPPKFGSFQPFRAGSHHT